MIDRLLRSDVKRLKSKLQVIPTTQDSSNGGPILNTSSPLCTKLKYLQTREGGHIDSEYYKNIIYSTTDFGS